MSAAKVFSDADLHSLVDGETDDLRRDEILAHLAIAPADAARVETWRQQNELIRAAFARIEFEPVPVSLSLTPPPRLVARNAASEPPPLDDEPPHYLRKQVSLLTVAFICGVIAASTALLLVYFVSKPALPPSASEVSGASTGGNGRAIANRSLELLRHSGTTGPGTPQGTAAPPTPSEFAETSEPVLKLPDLTAAGFSLTSGQVKQGNLGPSACAIYANAAGAEVSLCMEKALPSEDMSFRTADAFPHSAVYWREKNAIYALAGALPSADLLRLAHRVHAETSSITQP